MKDLLALIRCNLGWFQLVLIVLKLAEWLEFSWWWVLSPFIVSNLIAFFPAFIKSYKGARNDRA